VPPTERPTDAGNPDSPPASRNIAREIGQVTARDRAALLGQQPVTVWLTGLSGSGKSTLAKAVERRLAEAGRLCYVLDGDNLRLGLNRDLGFSPEDRRENIRRVAEVAKLMNEAGVIVVTAFISPYREDRERARRIVGEAAFLEIHVSTDIGTCEKRDPKGLYRKARAGEIPEFTGISAPYQAPPAPHMALDTASASIEECTERILAAIRVATAQPSSGNVSR
jgi:adenylyl-sulfate kinase